MRHISWRARRISVGNIAVAVLFHPKEHRTDGFNTWEVRVRVYRPHRAYGCGYGLTRHDAFVAAREDIELEEV